jgi:integrase
MARGKRSTNRLDTAAKRAALPARHHPYWQPLHRGVQIGYQQPRSGPGSWRLRAFVGTGGGAGFYAHAVLAPAIGEGLRASTDETAIDYADAVKLALERAPEIRTAGRVERILPGASESVTAARRVRDASSYTVADALADYADALEAEGKPSHRSARQDARALVLPFLGSRLVQDLRREDIQTWRDTLARTAPRRRRKDPHAPLEPIGTDDAEALRRRRVRVNRILGLLKAALNRARDQVRGLRPGVSDAWRSVPPFPKVARGRVRPLSPDEVARLLDAAPTSEFRDLLHAAVLTGARYAELADLRAGDFLERDGKLHFRKTKDDRERGRTIALSDEGVALFRRLTAGRPPEDRILVRPDGKAWKNSDQQRPMRAAVEAAGIPTYPTRPTFHNLRDSYAAALLRAGVPLEIVSKLLGHSSIELTRRHYADFVQSDLDRAMLSLPSFTKAPANVSRMPGGRRRA